MREVTILLGAELEIQRACERCSSERTAEALYSKILAALDQLAAQPASGRHFAGSFHRLLVSRSTYGLFYVIENRGVVVHALLDLRQSPARIMQRLDL